jgi:hypothetical protein
MIEKCVNPFCGEPFIYFRGGRIYVIDHSDLTGHKCPTGISRKTKCFWLCPTCCRQNTSAISLSNGAVRVVLYPKLPNSGAKLRKEDARREQGRIGAGTR